MPNDTDQAIFDPKEFLAKVGEGKTILEYRKDQIVFAQGDSADTVFYIQKGRVKVVVISEQYNGKIEVNSSLLNAVLYDRPEIMPEL